MVQCFTVFRLPVGDCLFRTRFDVSSKNRVSLGTEDTGRAGKQFERGYCVVLEPVRGGNHRVWCVLTFIGCS